MQTLLLLLSVIENVVKRIMTEKTTVAEWGVISDLPGDARITDKAKLYKLKMLREYVQALQLSVLQIICFTFKKI
jgi:hypothetical protein